MWLAPQGWENVGTVVVPQFWSQNGSFGLCAGLPRLLVALPPKGKRGAASGPAPLVAAEAVGRRPTDLGPSAHLPDSPPFPIQLPSSSPSLYKICAPSTDSGCLDYLWRDQFHESRGR